MASITQYFKASPKPATAVAAASVKPSAPPSPRASPVVAPSANASVSPKHSEDLMDSKGLDADVADRAAEKLADEMDSPTASDKDFINDEQLSDPDDDPNPPSFCEGCGTVHPLPLCAFATIHRIHDCPQCIGM